MRAKLTASTLKTLKPKNRRYDVRDIEIKGFLLRVQPSGKMIYFSNIGMEKGNSSISGLEQLERSAHDKLVTLPKTWPVKSGRGSMFKPKRKRSGPRRYRKGSDMGCVS